MAACAATFEVVYAPAPAALPVASKAQPCRPSLRPAAPSLRRLLRSLLFWAGGSSQQGVEEVSRMRWR